nr:protein aig2 c [Quercus suber]
MRFRSRRRAARLSAELRGRGLYDGQSSRLNEHRHHRPQHTRSAFPDLLYRLSVSTYTKNISLPKQRARRKMPGKYPKTQKGPVFKIYAIIVMSFMSSICELLSLMKRWPYQQLRRHQQAPQDRTAFFYGTLMAPEVLHRVCHGGMDAANPIYAMHNLCIRPAILPDFERHRVKAADYPAIIPRRDASVRGTLVTGLTDADIWRLDIFEGDEYQRREVAARVCAGDGTDDVYERQERAAEVVVETYVWVAGEQRLEEGEWDFEEFRREKMVRWVGAEGEGEYAELDEAVAKEQDGTGGRGKHGAISERLKEERNSKAEEALESAV